MSSFLDIVIVVDPSAYSPPIFLIVLIRHNAVNQSILDEFVVFQNSENSHVHYAGVHPLWIFSFVYCHLLAVKMQASFQQQSLKRFVTSQGTSISSFPQILNVNNLC